MKKDTATTSATIFAWRALAASLEVSVMSAGVIEWPMRLQFRSTGMKQPKRPAGRAMTVHTPVIGYRKGQILHHLTVRLAQNASPHVLRS
jgi:hypothetical protein